MPCRSPLWLAGVLMCFACGVNAPGAAAPQPPSIAAPEAAPRTALRLAIDADPNGLWWDRANGRLLIADNDGNRILAWTDSAGFSTLRELPEAGPDGAGLGQLVLTADGSIVVTRFGFGKHGDVVVAPPDGDAYVVPKLDVARRRIGLTVAPDGKLFDAWFVRLPSGERNGAVGALSLAGEEPEVISDLTKPVGVLALGETLFVSDQGAGEVYRAPLAKPGAYAPFASLAEPDLLAAGPDGSLFAGSAKGSVHRIDATGAVTTVQSGFRQVRGVAYDPEQRRLFVAEHDPDAKKNGTGHTLHVLPVD